MSFHDYTHVRRRPFVRRYIAGHQVPPEAEWGALIGSKQATMGATDDSDGFNPQQYFSNQANWNLVQSEYLNLPGTAHSVTNLSFQQFGQGFNDYTLMGIVDAEYFASNPSASPTSITGQNVTANIVSAMQNILQKLNTGSQSQAAQAALADYLALSPQQQYQAAITLFQKINADAPKSGTYSSFFQVYNVADIQAAIDAAKSTSAGVDGLSIVIGVSVVVGVILLYNFRSYL